MLPNPGVTSVPATEIDTLYTFRFDIRIPAVLDVLDEDRPTTLKHVQAFRTAIRAALAELWGVAYDGINLPDSCVTHYKVQDGDPDLLHHEQIHLDLS